jgi:hypothetical protein
VNVANSPTTVISGSASSPTVGASLDFVHNVYAIDVGSVGGGTAAEVATAANIVYRVAAGVAQEVEFFGRTSSGNVVVFLFETNTNTPSTIGATSFSAAETLVGIQASAIHASWFH